MFLNRRFSSVGGLGLTLGLVLCVTACEPGVLPSSTYTVTYVGSLAQSGTVPVDPRAYREGEPATVLGNPGQLSRDGFTFDGWKTTSGGTETIYPPGSLVPVKNSDVHLFSAWTEAPSPDLGFTLEADIGVFLRSQLSAGLDGFTLWAKPNNPSLSLEDIVLQFSFLREDGTGTTVNYLAPGNSGQHPNFSWFSPLPGARRSMPIALFFFDPEPALFSTWNQGFTKLRILASVKYAGMSAVGTYNQLDIPLVQDLPNVDGHGYEIDFFVDTSLRPAQQGELPRDQWMVWTELTATYPGGPGVVSGEPQQVIPGEGGDEFLVFWERAFRPAAGPHESWKVKLDTTGDGQAEVEWIVPDFSTQFPFFWCSFDDQGQPRFE